MISINIEIKYPEIKYWDQNDSNKKLKIKVNFWPNVRGKQYKEIRNET